MSEGLWKVGNGKIIRMFGDPWLHTVHDFRIDQRSDCQVSPKLRVSEVMNPDKSWNDELIRVITKPNVAEQLM